MKLKTFCKNVKNTMIPQTFKKKFIFCDFDDFKC